MSTNTTLLGLNLPATGGDSGIWGDDINNGTTQFIEMAVAGTNNITYDGDVTLSMPNGNNSSGYASTTTTTTSTAIAQYAVINCTGSRGAGRNIVVPTTSKTYVVINGTSGGFSITVKKSGGTGVTVANGETAIVYYNAVAGDVVKVTSYGTVLPVSLGGTGASTLTGLVKGNGTSAFTAAVSGTDYAPATSGSSILYGNSAGGFSNVTVGSGLSFSGGTLVSTAATTSGTSILYGNGSGGFSNVTVGSGLSFSGGTLISTVSPGTGTVTSVSGTGSANGLSLSGTVTTSGNITLSGNVTSLTTANFTVQQSGSKLIFQYGGTTIASLDSSGNFIALANVTAYGTP
jgi:hypothetical protein